VRHAIYEFAGFDFSSSSSTSRALWIDVHTNLGKYGDYSILTKNIGHNPPPNNDDASNEYAWVTKFTNFLEESNMGYGRSGDATSVGSGYDQTYGFVNDHILCPLPHCFPLTQEFGTRHGV